MRSPFQELDHCGHFFWMDKYIRDRGFQVEVLPPIPSPIQAPISSAMEEEMSRVVRPFEDFVVIGELQKLNKQLRKIFGTEEAVKHDVRSIFRVYRCPIFDVSMSFGLVISI